MPQIRSKNIANYLDCGSISLFSAQIAETLGNVEAIAIQNMDGTIAWSNDSSTDASTLTINPFKREKVPGPGFCDRLANNNLAYVFYLHTSSEDEPIATLIVQIDASNPASFEHVHASIEPVISCIERQIDINAELSAVRRMTDEGKKGVELLLQMDELDKSAGPHDILRNVLDLSAAHFSADLAAVVLPNLGIQEVFPEQLVMDKSTSKAVMTTLGSLFSSVKLHRRVLMSDANLKTKVITGLHEEQPKVLCSPIVNSKDDVIGVFVLMGPKDFTKSHIRLSRAICAKINSLTRTADQLADDHFTRHGFLQHVAGVIKRHPDRSHAMLYIDIDKLHVVNDMHGHMAGDRVIQLASRIIDEVAGGKDAVSHLSGDNFGLFLRDADGDKALQKAELILETLSKETADFDGKALSITASIGIALIPEVVQDAAAAVNTAEVASRSAKSRGGNRAVTFRDLDASVVQRRSDLDQVNYLQNALIHNRFELYAQRIQALDLEENRYRYEILVRMLDADDTLTPPDKFLPAAERYQMMSALDRWVIRNTLDALGNSDNMLEINLASFSINISAQSLADDDFLDFLESQIAQCGVSPDSLCFEITETAVVRNLERAQRCIRRLRKLGCRLALDDFGTGYCSFAYLKDLPVQYIKLDGVFVRDLLENPLSDAIVSSVANVAKVMKCATIAEHVENDLVIQRLRQLEIDFVQGFAIGRPRPLADAIREMGDAVLPDLSEVLASQEVNP